MTPYIVSSNSSRPAFHDYKMTPPQKIFSWIGVKNVRPKASFFYLSKKIPPWCLDSHTQKQYYIHNRICFLLPLLTDKCVHWSIGLFAKYYYLGVLGKQYATSRCSYIFSTLCNAITYWRLWLFWPMKWRIYFVVNIFGCERFYMETWHSCCSFKMCEEWTLPCKLPYWGVAACILVWMFYQRVCFLVG